MKNFVRKAGRAVGFGLLFCILRARQLETGFAATGLSQPSAAGKALAVCLLVSAAAELALALRMSGEKRPFRQQFAPAEGGQKTLLVMGGMLLAAGGAAMAVCAVTGGGIALAAAGVLGVAAGMGAVLFTQQIGHRVELNVMPLLPALFFSVFLVLAEYLPKADNPVLAQYYIPVLAAAMTAYAFSQLAGCVQGEGSPRWFTPIAELAAALCVGAAADGLGAFYPGIQGIARVLVYAGCALILLTFLLLQRREDELPPPEASEEPEEEAEEAVSKIAETAEGSGEA